MLAIKNHKLSKNKADFSPEKTKHKPESPEQRPLNPIWHGLATRLSAAADLFPVQTKLTVGAPNDKYEQEADHVADQVMRMTDPREGEELGIQRKTEPPMVQRVCAGCEEELQRQSMEEEPDVLQRRGESGGGTAVPQVSDATASQIQSLRGGGDPLSSETRAFFEPRFGRDFSQVRVHSDGRAAQATHAVQAKAFTTGRDIAFGTGEYAPESEQGRRLLGHELVHVVQQTGNDNLKRKKIDSATHIAPVIQTLTAPQVQGKWYFAGGKGNSGGQRGDSITDNGSISQTEICAPLKDPHKSCATTRAHAWQGFSWLKASEGGRAKAFRWVTSEYKFKNDHKNSDFLALRGKGEINGWAKAEDLKHARAAALIVGSITENPHVNRYSKKWFPPLKEGGISAASVGDLGQISADVPIGGGNLNITIPLTKVDEGMQAPINDNNSPSYNVPNSVDEVDITIIVRAEADADIVDELLYGMRDENTGRVLANFVLDWESSPTPSGATTIKSVSTSSGTTGESQGEEERRIDILRNQTAKAICKCVGEDKCGGGKIHTKHFTVTDKVCKNPRALQKEADKLCNHDREMVGKCDRKSDGGCRYRHTDAKCPV